MTATDVATFNPKIASAVKWLVDAHPPRSDRFIHLRERFGLTINEALAALRLAGDIRPGNEARQRQPRRLGDVHRGSPRLPQAPRPLETRQQRRLAKQCITSASGQILPVLANALIALRESLELSGILAYDEMLGAPMLKALPGAGGFPLRPLTDADVGIIQEWLQHRRHQAHRPRGHLPGRRHRARAKTASIRFATISKASNGTASRGSIAG